VSAKLKWQTPTVERVYDDLDALDAQRALHEVDMLAHYTDGVGATELEEARRHWLVDLVDDREHTPSRYLLRVICNELTAFYWPDQGLHSKQRKRDSEREWLGSVEAQIYWAATKYGDARNARTLAEQDVAEKLGLSLEGLRKRRERYRASVTRRDDALWQQRGRYPKQ
jgi:hypothetical protein